MTEQQPPTHNGRLSLHDRKAIVAVVGIVCLTVLLALGRAQAETVVPSIVGIVMYILGNGIAARTGRDSQPVISRRQPDD